GPAGPRRGQRQALGSRPATLLLDLHRPDAEPRGGVADRRGGGAGELRAGPRRNGQALRDPAQAPLPRGRRGHRNAQGQTLEHRRALRRPGREPVRVTDGVDAGDPKPKPRRRGRQSVLFRDRYEQDLQHVQGTAGWIGMAIAAAVVVALPLVAQGYVVY